jgi:hypothetical protein
MEDAFDEYLLLICWTRTDRRSLQASRYIVATQYDVDPVFRCHVANCLVLPVKIVDVLTANIEQTRDGGMGLSGHVILHLRRRGTPSKLHDKFATNQTSCK